MKAVTRRLDTDVDLLDAGELLFERNRLGLVPARALVVDLGGVLTKTQDGFIILHRRFAVLPGYLTP